MLFDFTKDYILENDKVKLEPLTQKHVQELQAISEEENLWTYFLGKSNGDRRFQEYVYDTIKGRQQEKEYSFAVFDKHNDRYAGSTRFFGFSEDFSGVRIGYTWYGSDFRGTGLNKNCKYLLFEFAFDRLQMERVGLGAHEENKVSIAAMKSIGCKQEGVVRNLFPSIHGSGRSHAMLLGMLKDEWLQNAKKNLKTRL